MTTLTAHTAQAVLAFLAQFHDKVKGDGHGTPLEAALWFCAYRDAETNVDCNRTKDWAYLLRDGFTGYKTEDDLQDFIESMREDTEYATPDEVATLERDLRDFFDLPDSE